MSSGIYQIKNLLNSKRYIGSAVNLQQRWAVHLSTLRHKCHDNSHLQRAFNKYGEEMFVFSILEQVEDSVQLIAREQHYFDTLKPEYNISPTAGSSLGIQHTEETRAKMRGKRNHNYGKHPDKETRRKISVATRGERNPMYGKHHSIETRAKISAALTGEGNANYGKHPSAATLKKMREAWTPERRQAQGDKQRGRHHNEETKQKLRMLHIGKHHTEETKRKISVANKGKHLSEEHKRKISDGLRTYWCRKRAEEQ